MSSTIRPAGHAHQPGGDLHPVETAFLAAWRPPACPEQADELATAALREAIASGDRDQVHGLADGGQVPLLLAISDNGPQMLSVTTREFMAGVAIARQFGRPGTPTGQAWIERRCSGTSRASGRTWRRSATPASFDAELDRVQAEYNSVRQHAAMGVRHPDDAHEGRGEAIRQARRDGLAEARLDRIAYRRNTTLWRTSDREPFAAEYYNRVLAHYVRHTSHWAPVVTRTADRARERSTSGGADAGDADR